MRTFRALPSGNRHARSGCCWTSALVAVARHVALDLERGRSRGFPASRSGLGVRRGHYERDDGAARNTEDPAGGVETPVASLGL